jgi:hypothetical protein
MMKLPCRILCPVWSRLVLLKGDTLSSQIRETITRDTLAHSRGLRPHRRKNHDVNILNIHVGALMQRALVALLALLFLGCTATLGKDLERSSARSISPTPYPDSVKITELQSGMSGAKWVATTPSGVYDCSIENGERQPICAKRHSSP